MYVRLAVAAAVLAASGAAAQTTNDPFPDPIEATDGVITVSVVEFAELPDFDGRAARMMLLVDEPDTGRLFVNDMHGVLYSVSYDGRTVTPYLDLTAPRWALQIEASRGERGFQSFAFHPQFGEAGTPGFGRFYTYTDTSDTAPPPDFVPGAATTRRIRSCWSGRPRIRRRRSTTAGRRGSCCGWSSRSATTTAGNSASTRARRPATPTSACSTSGLPTAAPAAIRSTSRRTSARSLARCCASIRSAPTARNGQYGVPADNPFAADGDDGTLGEIYAYGVRNPQRFDWDVTNGNLFVADIGQNIVEEISLVTAGANLGWNDWEGSFRFISRREVSLVDPRGEAGLSYPVAEWGQLDPLLQRSSAATGLVVYRDDAVPQLADKVLFGDNPSGEVFYVSADDLPDGGQDAIRRVLFNHEGETKTLLQLIQEKNRAQGRDPTGRADLRFGTGPDGRIFLLNKRDGVVRRLVP